MFRKPAHWSILLFVLLAFGRLVYALDAKDLWLDESFSLLRAESGLSVLLSGRLPVAGMPEATALSTHPPAYFALLRLVVALAGNSAFSLRFLSVLAATALVPSAWALARYLVRHDALPRGSAWWAALLCAVSPFYLWYGQEARMYACVALLAVVSTFFLLRWAEGQAHGRKYLVAYLVTISLLLTTHFYSVLILPVHAGVVFQYRLRYENYRRSLAHASEVLVLGIVPVSLGAWLLLSADQTTLGHFVAVTGNDLALGLLRDFSVGLSFEYAMLWWLPLVFAVLVVLGAAWAWTRRPVAAGAWILPAWLLVPPLLLLAINCIRPAYTSGREMSVISGAFLLLAGGGLAWVWQRSRWGGAGLALIVVAASAFSTANYFTDSDYGKGDLSGMGMYLRQQVQPGDLLLTEPQEWWRLYHYYLPVDLLENTAATGFETAWRNMPGAEHSLPADKSELLPLLSRYHRIWLVSSDPRSSLSDWLTEHASRTQRKLFESPLSMLRLELFVTPWPLLRAGELPGKVQNPVDVTFGDQLRLVGYDVGTPLAPGSAIPVTLYWQAPNGTSQRYKYRLDLIENGSNRQAAVSDRDFDGGLRPTTGWTVGTTVVEYAGIVPPEHPSGAGYRLSLLVYDAATLDRLPVTSTRGLAVEPGGNGAAVTLPLAQPATS